MPILAALRKWRLCVRQRRELMLLSEPELLDMRLSRNDVGSVIGEQYWRPVSAGSGNQNGS